MGAGEFGRKAVVTKMSQMIQSNDVTQAQVPGSEKDQLTIQKRREWLHRRLLDQTNRRLLEDPDRFLAEWGTFSRADGRLFEEKPYVGAIIVEEMTEAIRQGVEPIMHEHRLYKRDWGFSITQIQAPVEIWHGLADRQASIGASRFLDERIPSSHLHLVDGAGHFSLLANHQESIFESLLNL